MNFEPSFKSLSSPTLDLSYSVYSCWH